MPLMKKLFPSRELEIERPISRASKISNFANFEYDDDSNLDSNMDNPVVNRSRPKKKPSMPKIPTIPRRSSKRISTMLNNVVSELKCMDEFEATKQVVEEPESEISDPHELYLSSEEDASLSDTDTLLDFEVAPFSEYSSSRSSSRASAEDTARVISFTLVSKPRVIEIPRPTSFHSNPIFRNVCPVTDYQIRHSVADIASLVPIPRHSHRDEALDRTRRFENLPVASPSPLSVLSPNSTQATATPPA